MTTDTSTAPKNKLVRIENKFLFHARYYLPARDQKVILYLASQLQPGKQEDFHRQRIPLKELERVLKASDSKWGGIYKELSKLPDRLTDRKITFPTDFLIEGKPIKGNINWFQHVIPVENEEGQICLEFMFADILKPFLLKLNEYVRLNLLEVAPMSSGHAIRVFQILKAERERTKKQPVSELEFRIEELKTLLGIPGKYPVLKDFRRRVLEPIENEINEHSSSIKVDYQYLKTGRKVTGVKFRVWGKIEIPHKDYVPTGDEVQVLPRAKMLAFQKLVKFGVKPGIAYKMLLPMIKGSELKGFEDWFVDFALNIFSQKSDQPNNAGVLVTWWYKQKVFTEGDVWAKIVEQITSKKKQRREKNTDAMVNREKAATMSNAEFEEWYENNEKQTF